MCLQVIPLLMFPPASYSLSSQEWWLPVLLTCLVVISLVKLFTGGAVASWPWFLISFAQGFNIISRMMMALPHATMNDKGVQVFNAAYVWITVAAMLVSAFEIWYCDLPEIRSRMQA